LKSVPTLSCFQIRFSWPEEEQSDDGALIEKDRKDAKTNDISYMSDQLGLHRVQVGFNFDIPTRQN
jgi:hypothetical protein